jgi:fatty acid desaturase
MAGKSRQVKATRPQKRQEQRRIAKTGPTRSRSDKWLLLIGFFTLVTLIGSVLLAFTPLSTTLVGAVIAGTLTATAIVERILQIDYAKVCLIKPKRGGLFSESL